MWFGYVWKWGTIRIYVTTRIVGFDWNEVLDGIGIPAKVASFIGKNHDWPADFTRIQSSGILGVVELFESLGLDVWLLWVASSLPSLLRNQTGTTRCKLETLSRLIFTWVEITGSSVAPFVHTHISEYISLDLLICFCFSPIFFMFLLLQQFNVINPQI